MPRTEPAHIPTHPGSATGQPERDEFLDRIAWLMDSAIKIPGTNVTVGLDSLLGLVPGLGDGATGLVQIGLVLLAMKRYNVPKHVAVRMATNVLLDIGLGAVPILGDVFDVFFKANTRNMKLLRETVARETGELPTARVVSSGEAPSASTSPARKKRSLSRVLSGSPMGQIVAVGVGLFVSLGVIIALFVVLFLWLFGLTPTSA